MAPAVLRKEGSAYDLTLAVGILAASSQIKSEDIHNYVIMGELSLDGGLQPIKGALSIAIKAKEEGYVTTLFNRKRIVEELNSDVFVVRSAGERIALNTPIQGTSADIIKKAMVDISKCFKERKLKAKMILQVHDELIFDTPNDEVKEVKEIIEDKMENVIKLSVPIKVEIDEGENWYEAN